MIYTPLTKKAMKIAFEMHKEQVDKSGVPYIYHPIHIAEQMDDEKSVCIALLHDVVEDTDITLEQLKEQGFGEDILDALRLMTYDKSTPYMDYIHKIKKNPTAVKVKIADIKHNSDLTRLNEVSENDLRYAKRYADALEFLTD